MSNILISLIRTLCCGFRSCASLLAEILALRHPLAILKRSAKKRPRPGKSDRFLWVWLSRWWPDWRNPLLIVKILQSLPWDTAPRYLLRDRDSISGDTFRMQVSRMGIKEVLTAPQSPWQSPYVERLIGSIRRECLDHIITIKRELAAVEAEYKHCTLTLRASPELRIKFYDFFVHQRAILDYLAHDIAAACTSIPRKIYFRLAKPGISAAKFRQKMDKEWMPGLSVGRPDLFALLDSVQPYNDNAWIEAFISMTNSNKHFALMTCDVADCLQAGQPDPRLALEPKGAPPCVSRLGMESARLSIEGGPASCTMMVTGAQAKSVSEACSPGAQARSMPYIMSSRRSGAPRASVPIAMSTTSASLRSTMASMTLHTAPVRMDIAESLTTETAGTPGRRHSRIRRRDPRVSGRP